jgi:hypothetical protein
VHITQGLHAYGTHCLAQLLWAKTFEKHVISVQVPCPNTKTSPHFWVRHTNQALFASDRSIAKSGVHAVFVLHICSGYDLKVSLATEKSGCVYRHYGSNIDIHLVG